MSKPQLPTEVYLAADEVVDWTQFCIIQARHANVTHASSKLKFTPEIIEKLAIICQSEDDLEEDAPPVLWLVLEDICKLHVIVNHFPDQSTQVKQLQEERDKYKEALEVWDAYFDWRVSDGDKSGFHHVSDEVVKRCQKVTRKALNPKEPI